MRTMDNAAQQCMRVPARLGSEAQNVTADHGQSIVFGSCGSAMQGHWIDVMHTCLAPRKSKASGVGCLSCSGSR